MWGDIDVAEVKLTWAQELAGFEADDIRASLDVMRTAYPDYPPTLFQFFALCRDAKHRRSGAVLKLPAPKPSREEAEQALRRLRRLLAERKNGRERQPGEDA